MSVVIYIEDDPVSAMLVRHIFESRPQYALHVACDGMSALRLARHLKPVLFLVDMMLPDMSGCELLHMLRDISNLREVPCVAVSAQAMSGDIEKARANGFDDYWIKPINVEVFLEKIDNFIGKENMAIN